MAGIGDVLVDCALIRGGFTWKPAPGSKDGVFYCAGHGGYGVSVPGHEFVIDTWHNPAVMAAFVNMYVVLCGSVTRHGRCWVGGWMDGDKLYLDLTVIVQDEGAARQLAVDNGQIAYYDFSKAASVNV